MNPIVDDATLLPAPSRTEQAMELFQSRRALVLTFIGLHVVFLAFLAPAMVVGDALGDLPLYRQWVIGGIEVNEWPALNYGWVYPAGALIRVTPAAGRRRLDQVVDRDGVEARRHDEPEQLEGSRPGHGGRDDRKRTPVILTLMIAALTSLIFPVFYMPLLDGDVSAAALLTARNALLIVLLGWSMQKLALLATAPRLSLAAELH